jgi:CheY-like chemotaxis protein
MQRLRLIHWSKDEAEGRAAVLAKAGYEVAFEVPRGPEFLRELKDNPPAAIVIDLSRAPSQGRDVALALRKNSATRRIPLVFVEGEESVAARIRELLPDAVFTSWKRIRGPLKRAISHPPKEPRVPSSVFAGYSGAPLPKKLGIKPGLAVGLIDAPEGFARTLDPAPEGAELRIGAQGRCDLLICFIRSVRDMERRIEEIATRTDYASVWLAWPKSASGLAVDLTQQRVRECGVAEGLVDYKICAIDQTWSALLFTRRKKTPQRH